MDSSTKAYVSDEYVMEARLTLEQLLQEQSTFFLGIIRSYVARMHLVDNEGVGTLALIVWQETALEALGHVERFAQARQPRAWVLAVAANILKRRRDEIARRSSRELPLSTLLAKNEDAQESAFFEQFASMTVPSPEQEVVEREQVREMLALVPEEDQHVLRLALLHDLDGHMLAHALQVLPSTARSRFHRALARLRAAWIKHEQHIKEKEREHV